MAQSVLRVTSYTLRVSVLMEVHLRFSKINHVLTHKNSIKDASFHSKLHL